MGKKYLIIGGSHDGEWIETDIRGKSLRLSDKITNKLPEEAKQCPVIKMEIYTISAWHTPTAIFELLTLDGMSPEEVFEALLNGYKTPCQALYRHSYVVSPAELGRL
jgi:hypothetical protein